MAMDYKFEPVDGKAADSSKVGAKATDGKTTEVIRTAEAPKHNASGEKLVPVTMRETEVRYLTEQEAARERLKASVDALTQQASLQAKMQAEPLKMIGGASAVGAVLGMVVGRQFRRSKKIYVNADSPDKHQKALIKAQQKSKGQDMGGALVATLGTLAFKMVMDKVVTPKLEEMADKMMDKAGQPTGRKSSALLPRADERVNTSAPSGTVPAGTPIQTSYSASVTPNTQGRSSGVTSFIKPTHVGVVPMPESKVEAKAVGTPISEAERHNPNE